MKVVNMFFQFIKGVRSVSDWEKAVQDTIKARKGKKRRGRYEQGQIEDPKQGLIVDVMINKLHEAKKYDAEGIERNIERNEKDFERGFGSKRPVEYNRTPSRTSPNASLHDLIQAVRADNK